MRVSSHPIDDVIFGKVSDEVWKNSELSPSIEIMGLENIYRLLLREQELREIRRFTEYCCIFPIFLKFLRWNSLVIFLTREGEVKKYEQSSIKL